MKQICSQCDEIVNDDSLIAFGDKKVCGTCKQSFVQRIKEGSELTQGPSSHPLGPSKGYKVAFGISLLISIAIAVPMWVAAIWWSNPENRELNQHAAFSHPLSIVWLWICAIHPIFILLAMTRFRLPIYVAILLPLCTMEDSFLNLGSGLHHGFRRASDRGLFSLFAAWFPGGATIFRSYLLFPPLATMPSADFSDRLLHLSVSVALRHGLRPPRVRHITFTLMPAAFTQLPSVQVLDFDVA